MKIYSKSLKSSEVKVGLKVERSLKKYYSSEDSWNIWCLLRTLIPNNLLFICLFSAQYFFPSCEVLQKLTQLVKCEVMHCPQTSSYEPVVLSRRDRLCGRSVNLSETKLLLQMRSEFHDEEDLSKEYLHLFDCNKGVLDSCPDNLIKGEIWFLQTT